MRKNVDLSKYYKVNLVTGCWEATVGLSSSGYCNICFSKTVKELLHRYVYKIVKGEIPAGMYLDHLCRNKICCNPDHLEPVTHAENIRRGNSAKLTAEEIKEIRNLEGTMTQTQLAVRYNVNQCNISRILNYRRWK